MSKIINNFWLREKNRMYGEDNCLVQLSLILQYRDFQTVASDIIN